MQSGNSPVATGLDSSRFQRCNSFLLPILAKPRVLEVLELCAYHLSECRSFEEFALVQASTLKDQQYGLQQLYSLLETPEVGDVQYACPKVWCVHYPAEPWLRLLQY